MHVGVVLCFLFLSFCSKLQGARILIYLPYHTWSHYMQLEPFYEALTTKGHTVTMYSPFPPKQNITGFKHVYHYNEEFKIFLDYFSKRDILQESGSTLRNLISDEDCVYKFTEDMLNNTEFHNLINSKEPFDLIMTESLFLQEATIVLGHLFQCPVIHLRSGAIRTDVLHAMHNPNIISIMPDLDSTLSDKMNLFDRMKNTYYAIARFLVSKYKYRRLDSLLKTYLGPNIPPIETLLRNISLCLLYSHPALEYPYPKVPNLVEVGGVHIWEAKNEILPADLKKILDDAKDGFVYFSLGSVVTPNNVPKDKVNIIIESFSKLPKYKFIWKWTGESSSSLPNNIIQRKWLPQRPILAHPNCKLFITHGGQSSQLETIFHGVPSITLPFFGDQHKNAMKSVDFEFGLALKFSKMTHIQFETAISTVLTDKRFKENAMKRSKIMRDVQSSPLDTALYWVDHVLQHKGASHLKPTSKYLTWYQYYLLDVIGFILCSILFVLLSIIWTIQKIWLGIGRRKTKKNIKNKKE